MPNSETYSSTSGSGWREINMHLWRRLHSHGHTVPEEQLLLYLIDFTVESGKLHSNVSLDDMYPHLNAHFDTCEECHDLRDAFVQLMRRSPREPEHSMGDGSWRHSSHMRA